MLLEAMEFIPVEELQRAKREVDDEEEIDDVEWEEKQ